MMLDPKWESRAVDPATAVASIRSRDNVFVHGAALTPTVLLEALCAREDLEGVRAWHLHLHGHIPMADPGVEKRVRSHSLFTGGPVRKAVQEARADFVPIFLSDIPRFIKRGGVKLRAAIVRMSPPDRHGMCSLGTSVDVARAAVDHAEIVIAEIDELVPRTTGHTTFPFAKLHAFTKTNYPPHEADRAHIGPIESRIGEIVAGLVEDGSTLQAGIGAIPDAVMKNLHGKNDLGLHTEMFSDGAMELLEAGVITNRRKKVHQGRSTTAFVNGSHKLYQFVHENALIEFHGADRTNDTSIIRQNPKVVAVNSALSIDLTGQVCADSLGCNIYSGIGGQMDFIHGAALSDGGKPIIALPSTASKGSVSRICSMLAPGSGVVTTRGHVHWVVTEYGAVNLWGKSLRERAEALISIAHPDFRSELRAQAKETRHFDLADWG